MARKPVLLTPAAAGLPHGIRVDELNTYLQRRAKLSKNSNFLFAAIPALAVGLGLWVYIRNSFDVWYVAVAISVGVAMSVFVVVFFVHAGLLLRSGLPFGCPKCRKPINPPEQPAGTPELSVSRAFGHRSGWIWASRRVDNLPSGRHLERG